MANVTKGVGEVTGNKAHDIADTGNPVKIGGHATAALRSDVGEADRVILNGLPRHVGQAADVGRIVDVQTVISLSCTPEVVFERIKKNSGGDRGGRVDDDESAVARKLEIYRDRIAPLLVYYRNRGAAIVTIDVTAATTPAEMAAMI